MGAYAGVLRRMVRETSDHVSHAQSKRFVRTVFLNGLANTEWRQKIRELKDSYGFPDMAGCLDKARGLEAAANSRKMITAATARRPEAAPVNKVLAYKAAKRAGRPLKKEHSIKPDEEAKVKKSPVPYNPHTMSMREVVCFNCQRHLQGAAKATVPRPEIVSEEESQCHRRRRGQRVSNRCLLLLFGILTACHK